MASEKPNARPGDCVFCKVVEGEIPAPKLYEDQNFICVRDIRPQAPTHLLILPKEHITSLDAAFPEQGESRTELIGRLFETGVRVARQQGLLPGGFRSVINTGPDGGQTVFHIHLHLLGGATLNGDFA
jgi:histidine triad (HIT) family protein